MVTKEEERDDEREKSLEARYRRSLCVNHVHNTLLNQYHEHIVKGVDLCT